MIGFFISFLTFFNAFLRSRYSLGLEILALRQQLGVLKRKHPRPQLRIRDRVFGNLLRRYWPAWSNTLDIVDFNVVAAGTRDYSLMRKMSGRTSSSGVHSQ